jgi:hypothetical protein
MIYEFEYPRLVKIENNLSHYNRNTALYPELSKYLGIQYSEKKERRDLMIIDYEKLFTDYHLHYELSSFRRSQKFVLNWIYLPLINQIERTLVLIDNEIISLEKQIWFN